MTRMRLSIRALMLATVVLACSIEGILLWRRSAEFRRQAGISKGLASLEDEEIRAINERRAGGKTSDMLSPRFIISPLTTPFFMPSDEEQRARAERLRAIYNKEWLKYDDAARHPWRSLSSDPPAPE